MTTQIPPTRGQLERTLSQRIQAFYRKHLGHQPSQVTCQLFDNKLAIIVEDSVTPAEQLLVQEGQDELAEQVRASLDSAIQSELQELIEAILAVKVTDLLSDAALETGRTGTIAILASSPQVRSPQASSKTSKKKQSNDR
ncbi:DUF2294 domain-containing protein [Lusitaniella coriacea LEGE 07157]|uniref:DUF2294 domain-containing protein n=1 Tax=Lusitaniella coriacea LEGE 07157 TaxID=945747 RepID=A0A8J7E2G1_9CYAN|nr:DUF2294 domain-containing protein [Lusitaniella coriacea]MBE9118466.1 DUF2294 domain-containing protein [Lusitaniella coriacea LEGE 07157]